MYLLINQKKTEKNYYFLQRKISTLLVAIQPKSKKLNYFTVFFYS